MSNNNIYSYARLRVPVALITALMIRSNALIPSIIGRRTTFQGATMKILIQRQFVTRSSLIMMPEGPEVRTVVDQLQGGINMRLLGFQWISGRYERNGPPETYPAFVETLTTSDDSSSSKQYDIIQEWNAKGKFIYIVLDKGAATGRHDNETDDDFLRSIWITLAMTGRFVSEAMHDAGDNTIHARWYMSLLNTETGKIRRIYYYDQRNFGTVKFCLSKAMLTKKLQSLGPDILCHDTSEHEFLQVMAAQRNKNLNVCKFLMNQENISGVGNYILAEGLYRASIDPFASLHELSDLQKRALFHELQSTAFESYEAQGMTRAKGGSYRDVQGNRGTFEFQLQVYGRKVCARGNPVHMEINGPHSRTIWYTQEQLFMPRSMRDENKGTATNHDSSGNDRTAAELIGKGSGTSDAVQRLTSGLKEVGWKMALSKCIASPSFRKLAAFLDDERSAGTTIYPPQEDTFAALNLCPLDKVKVVIVGQDPYHGQGQGHGLAFSVRTGVRVPPSLVNIFKEACQDVGISMPRSGCLTCWAEQGVLLLNSVLTVREGEANSHAKQGWEEFTNTVIDTLSNEKADLVFLLWGNPAAKIANGVDESKHTIIRTSHPSPLGASKTNSPFLGSRCFSRTNEALEKTGKGPIDWNVP